MVLESEEMAGGRMSTQMLKDIPIDIGAQFITSFYKNIWNLSEELNLEPSLFDVGNVAILRHEKLFSLNPKNLRSLCMFGGISPLSKIRLAFVLFYKLVMSSRLNLYDLKKNLALDDKSVYDDLVDIVEKESFTNLLDPMCEALFWYDSKEFSNVLFLAILRKVLFCKFYSFENGIGKLTQKISEKLDIHYQEKVVSIIRKKVGVTVITNKKSYCANRVIVAIPGNEVLNVLDTPTNLESQFFSQIRYSTAAYIFCQAKTKIFSNCNTIWLPEKENEHFSSISKNNHVKNYPSTHFSLAIRDSALRKLTTTNRLHKHIISKMIIESFDFFQDLQIDYIHIWDSALPKFVPGFLRQKYDFLDKTQFDKQIFYCGDYLESPSVEGALTSGIKLAKQLINE
ncbi:hypothetical protein COU87_02090 [Candidatus Roizmanbacteria bacterium CG10_big_fil_rev_8_21_14_0_10_39_12]|uniref:Amine oxidase domain-containing protein n=1 Tax=Candidatus Roizmanbacteria bacterium CG10_big_fil_rev_8_21_14_0_10_39_12 TaxID=1974852 RepID=A0A2M8KPQ6_9BACT|nr:MAG: hypothetical protein COU87_02090 [Candidatus Roizmanbacteria bacterium CG10_big_fil_rev_8_21_14_0_10_39_12]